MHCDELSVVTYINFPTSLLKLKYKFIYRMNAGVALELVYLN